MSKRPLLGERQWQLESFKGTGILEFLEDRNLLFTITNPTPFVSAIMYEFYANLFPQILQPNSPKYLKVFVRGEEFEFSPKLIIEYFVRGHCHNDEFDELRVESDLNSVATELTGSAMNWPLKHPFQSAKLTTKYSILLRIALNNLILKIHSNTFSPQITSFLFRLGIGTSIDLESLIFRKIISETDSVVTRNILGYPSLIFNLLISQKDIKDARELLTMLPKLMTMSDKLLHRSHLVDIEGDHDAAETSKTTEFKFSGDIQPVVTKIFSDLESIQQMQQVILEELHLQRSQIESIVAAVETLSSRDNSV